MLTEIVVPYIRLLHIRDLPHVALAQTGVSESDATARHSHVLTPVVLVFMSEKGEVLLMEVGTLRYVLILRENSAQD